MKIIDLVNRLEALEKMAGKEAWGGEYREDMFDVLLHYFRLCNGRVSAGGLLAYMVDQSENWFVKHGERKGGNADG